MVNKTVEENTEIAIEMTVMTEAETGLEKGHFPENYGNDRTGSKIKVYSGQDPELNTNKDRIHCYKV